MADDAAALNVNVCEHCLTAAGKGRPPWSLADTGVCGCCGMMTEVFDLELLRTYEAQGLAPEIVWRTRPRLRNSHIPKIRAQ